MTNLLDERIDTAGVRIGHMGTEPCVLCSTGPIRRCRQYHRPIDSSRHLESNRSIAALFV